MAKRGRPKKERLYEVWEHKYYVLSDKNNSIALKKTLQERLFKGYSTIFTLAHEKEPNQIDRGKINKVVAGIIDEI